MLKKIIHSIAASAHLMTRTVQLLRLNAYDSPIGSAWSAQLSNSKLVSFAAVIRLVTQCSSPTNGCSLELCIPFPFSLRTNNMHVTVSSCTNHISQYICRQRSTFPRNRSLLLIGQVKERNVTLEWAAVSWGGTLRDNPNNGCKGG